MPTLPTFQDVYDAGKSEIQARNAALTDFAEGSALDAITGGTAVMVDEAFGVLIDLFAAQFVDTAEGADLEALAADRFGLTRNAAAAAVVTLTFTRGGSTGTLVVPAGTTCEALVNGVRYQFDTDYEVEMHSSASTVTVTATCTVTGRAGNVAANTIDDIIDTLAGDATATVANAEAAAGGAPEETDAQFRDRIRRYFSTLRKGTVAALEAGALNVAGVSFVTVDESLIHPDDGGYVAVYVGDPDAVGNDALADIVEAELEEWRAAGILVRVFGSDREEIAMAISVTARAGVDTSAMSAAVRAAALGVTNNLAPKQTLYLSKVEAAVHAVSDDILSVQVTTPSADTTPTASQNAIRVNDADLEITITEVA